MLPTCRRRAIPSWELKQLQPPWCDGGGCPVSHEPAAALAGDRAARDRTEVATGQASSAYPRAGPCTGPRTEYQAAVDPNVEGRMSARASRSEVQAGIGVLVVSPKRI